MNKMRRKQIQQAQVKLMMVAQALELVAAECDEKTRSAIQSALSDIKTADEYLDDARD